MLDSVKATEVMNRLWTIQEDLLWDLYEVEGRMPSSVLSFYGQTWQAQRRIEEC